MVDGGIEVAQGGVVARQRDDMNSRTGWPKPPFDDHNERPCMFGEIEAVQSVQVDFPGPATMSASGWPFSSCHAAWAANALALALSHC